jgi:hypothetical protein
MIDSVIGWMIVVYTYTLSLTLPCAFFSFFLILQLENPLLEDPGRSLISKEISSPTSPLKESGFFCILALLGVPIFGKLLLRVHCTALVISYTRVSIGRLLHRWCYK